MKNLKNCTAVAWLISPIKIGAWNNGLNYGPTGLLHGDAFIYIVLLTAVITIGVIIAAMVEIEERKTERKGHSMDQKASKTILIK